MQTRPQGFNSQYPDNDVRDLLNSDVTHSFARDSRVNETCLGLPLVTGCRSKSPEPVQESRGCAADFLAGAALTRNQPEDSKDSKGKLVMAASFS